MISIEDKRLQNGRAAIKHAGGPANVARLMGYRNASYIVQIFGPNPTRSPIEKTCRGLEAALGLLVGELDNDPSVRSQKEADSAGLSQSELTRSIKLVSRLAQEESVNLSPERLATLVMMAYEESVEFDGSVREDRLRKVIPLLR